MPCEDGEDDDDDCCDGEVEVTIVVVVVSPMCIDDSVAVVDVGECDETVVERMNFSPDDYDIVGDGYSDDCGCHGVTMRRWTDG